MRIKNRGWIIPTVLVFAAIVLFVTCAFRSAVVQDWLCAGAMFGFAVASLVVEIILCCKGQRSNIASAFSLLSVIISLTIFLGWVCFQSWWEGMPKVALLILVIGYVITVIGYLIYFVSRKPETDPHLGSWNFLKGFGGATFAEFAGGVGILVSIGIYLVYTPEASSSIGGFWWAAQLAALISLFSAAAWVQRYVLEEPTYPALSCMKTETSWHRLIKTGPNLLNSIAALLTMLAILLPTTENKAGLNAALGDYKWLIWVAWGVVLLSWFMATLVPLCQLSTSDSWPKNPPNAPSWQKRKTIGLFLVLTIIILLMSSIIFVIVSFISHNSEWSSNWSTVAAAIAAGLFVFGIFWKWRVDQYEEEADSELKMLMIFRDIALFVCGIVIFIVQIWGVGDSASPLSTLYKFILGMMAYSTVIGILIGAYKWSSKRPPRKSLYEDFKQFGELSQLPPSPLQKKQ